MRAVARAVVDWVRSGVSGWNQFWFAPADPATLSLMRVLAGAMLFYTHLVWSLELESFFGTEAWISPELLKASWAESDAYFWSHLLWIESPRLLWAVHILALIVFAMLTLGLFSRTSAVLAYLLTVAYIHRAQNALFGLDQINVMLALYLIIGPCGACYSLDAWLKRRRTASQGDDVKLRSSASANVAIRLMQIHMCVIYFFAGTRKLLGATWWNGTAMWGSLANLEYQSIDMTWTADWPMMLAAFTHLTILFEISYPALIWPRWTRPVYLLLAVWLHLGIALFMGMATFGLAMIIGNAAFLRPEFVRTMLKRRSSLRLQAT